MITPQNNIIEESHTDGRSRLSSTLLTGLVTRFSYVRTMSEPTHLE